MRVAERKKQQRNKRRKKAAGREVVESLLIGRGFRGGGKRGSGEGRES